MSVASAKPTLTPLVVSYRSGEMTALTRDVDTLVAISVDVHNGQVMTRGTPSGPLVRNRPGR